MRKVSTEQRELMLEFMMSHPDLARGRVTGAEGSRQKARLLAELKDILNAVGSGTSKSPEKWWKCWQDWRCDVKSKGIKIKNARSATGGGPAPPPLTKLEESLLQFCGKEMVEGVRGVPDPLELELDPATGEFVFPASSSTQCLNDIEPPSDSTHSNTTEVEDTVADPSGTRNQRHARQDPLLTSLERQANAIQSLASVLEHGLADVASALREIATAMMEQNNSKQS